MTTLALEEATARACFDDFYFWRRKTHFYADMKKSGRAPKDAGWNDARRLLMLEFVAWCRAKTVDPRLLIYSHYVARNWLHFVKLETLQSDRILKRYRAGHFASQLEPYRRHIAEVPVRVAGEAAPDVRFDPTVDLSAEVEARKLRYQRLGVEQSCISQIVDAESPTYGYHPKSAPCRGCRLAPACREQTSKMFKVDIVAVREGILTREQAATINALR